MTSTPLRPEGILCIGELLWDVYPEDRHLGGAPPNVAVHLRSLGLPAYVVSRVGLDEAGNALITRLAELGVPADLVQWDPDSATGTVTVDLTDPASPRYTIDQPAAWDFIARTSDLEKAASNARAIVFGSLAQRGPTSRETIRTILPDGVLRVFDVNLRAPFDNRAVVESSLPLSDVVKLNDAELQTLRAWLDLPADDREACEAIRERFGSRTIVVTRGGRGAAMLHNGEWRQHPGYGVRVVDTVGAGDAFLAALLRGMLLDTPVGEWLPSANAVGAYVATQRGATPPLDWSAIRLIMKD